MGVLCNYSIRGRDFLFFILFLQEERDMRVYNLHHANPFAFPKLLITNYEKFGSSISSHYFIRIEKPKKIISQRYIHKKHCQ